VARKRDGEALRQHVLKGRCATLQVVTNSERICNLVTRIPVAETVYYARRQQGLPVMSRNTALLTGGGSAATWSEGLYGNWRGPRCPPKKPRRKGPAYNRECRRVRSTTAWPVLSAGTYRKLSYLSGEGRGNGVAFMGQTRGEAPGYDACRKDTVFLSEMTDIDCGCYPDSPDTCDIPVCPGRIDS
jgi:hypothetical protein